MYLSGGAAFHSIIGIRFITSFYLHGIVCVLKHTIVNLSMILLIGASIYFIIV